MSPVPEIQLDMEKVLYMVLDTYHNGLDDVKHPDLNDMSVPTVVGFYKGIHQSPKLPFKIHYKLLDTDPEQYNLIIIALPTTSDLEDNGMGFKIHHKLWDLQRKRWRFCYSDEETRDCLPFNFYKRYDIKDIKSTDERSKLTTSINAVIFDIVKTFITDPFVVQAEPFSEFRKWMITNTVAPANG